MKTFLRRLIGEEDGQDLIEYALLAAFIALAATAVMILLGKEIAALFQRVVDKLTAAGA
jgi:Flp pilus assembly pilin Flp